MPAIASHRPNGRAAPARATACGWAHEPPRATATARAIAELLAYAAAPGVIWDAVPNGGWRSKTEAAIFAGLGVKPGVGDLALVLAWRPDGVP
ncbi:MAG TPA: hypothetical protein VGL31_18920 [Xanthobacteraceae bacterium]